MPVLLGRGKSYENSAEGGGLERRLRDHAGRSCKTRLRLLNPIFAHQSWETKGGRCSGLAWFLVVVCLAGVALSVSWCFSIQFCRREGVCDQVKSMYTLLWRRPKHKRTCTGYNRTVLDCPDCPRTSVMPCRCLRTRDKPWPALLLQNGTQNGNCQRSMTPLPKPSLSSTIFVVGFDLELCPPPSASAPNLCQCSSGF